jgi:hypothetical protein
MKTRHVVVWLVFVAFLVSGRPATGRQEKECPFAGKWKGTSEFKSEIIANSKGTYRIRIDSKGKVTGSGEDTTHDLKFDLKGSINEDGQIEFTVVFEHKTCVMKGTVTKTKKGGHMKGTLTQYEGKKNAGSEEIDLAPDND